MWLAEHKVIWLLPSGDRKPGRIAIGMPERVDGAADEYRCAYVLEGVGRGDSVLRGQDSLQAMYFAWMMVGHELYWLFCGGVRVVYPREDSDEPEDPEADTASLIGMLGPLVRGHGNPRGVADTEGKLAKFDALIEAERRRWEGEPEQEPER